MPAPIALFAYARLEHLRRTVEYLLRNPESSSSDLIVFSDGARTVEKESAVKKVREYIRSIEGFRTITVHNRPANYGLARSIIEGVSRVLAEHEAVIVLEDDMVTSPYFLRYMNEALARFVDDDRVISIHGYVYPTRRILPEAFFLPGADCWGWATWRRGWELFNPDGRALLAQLEDGGLSDSFDFGGTYPFARMLRDQVEGANDSWAVRWYASAFLAGKVTLYPGRSLVNNIGNDSSGTHCTDSSAHDAALSTTPIEIDNVCVEVSAEAKTAFEEHFRALRPSVVNRLRGFFRRVARLAG